MHGDERTLAVRSSRQQLLEVATGGGRCVGDGALLGAARKQQRIKQYMYESTQPVRAGMDARPHRANDEFFAMLRRVPVEIGASQLHDTQKKTFPKK